MPQHNLERELIDGEFTNPGTAGNRIMNVQGEGRLFGWGDTVPADAATGWASGALFQHLDGSGVGDVLFVNIGSTTSSNFDPLSTGETGLEADLAATTTGNGASKIGIEDAGTFTAAVNAEAALAELFQHLFSTQSFIPIPLMGFREATNFDVDNVAANGGLLASDTTPILEAINAATDGAQRLNWASSNVDEVIAQVPLPPDLDTTKDIDLHLRAGMAASTDTPTLAITSFFNEGDTAVVDTSPALGSSVVEVITPIAAADIPSGAQTMSFRIVPGRGNKRKIGNKVFAFNHGNHG